jgi:hypothetical protein
MIILCLAKQASGGCCPKQVADLVLVLNPNAAAVGSGAEIPLRLHLWAAAKRTYKLSRNNNQDGMLEPLLRAYPEAAAVVDNDGRWRTALASEKSMGTCPTLV